MCPTNKTTSETIPQPPTKTLSQLATETSGKTVPQPSTETLSQPATDVVYACGVMFGLEGLSPIGVWDVLGGWTHDGHGTG
ncbi:hypothetical protein DEO72_LG6g387 [Vigna unguiculata]|uniref:Uncharacterized protein n=1 Tax=Vigna unguiculata TaxID=3917 RepID=A0A4D6M384_VIGUN|nr:hypothetical protein DEO72_LG6g387 [Vigna unguiculata]